MAIKSFEAYNGTKIKIGNKKANLALKLLDHRIKMNEKVLGDYIRKKEWSNASNIDYFIAGLQNAFWLLHEEFKNK